MASELELLEEAEKTFNMSEEEMLAQAERDFKAQPQPSTGSMVGDFARGVRRTLTRGVTEPGIGDRYIADPIQRFIGLDPDARRERIRRKEEERTGTRVEAAPATWSEKFGEATPAAVEAGLATIAGGPMLAGIRGSSLLARVLRSTGEFAQARPIGTMAGALTGVPGGVVGGEYGGQAGGKIGEAVGGEVGKTAGTIMGSIFGGIVGGTVTGMPGSAIGSRVGVPREIANKVPGGRMLMSEMGRMKQDRIGLERGAQPLLQEGADAADARAYVDSQSTSVREGIDRSIHRVIDSLVPNVQGASARQRQRLFHRQLNALEREQSDIVDAMWERVPRHNVFVPSDRVTQVIDNMMPGLQTEPQNLPGDTMRRIIDLVRRVDPNTGDPIDGPMSLDELIRLRRSIGQDIRTAAQGSEKQAPNGVLVRNLEAIETALLDSVPDNIPQLRQAAEATRIYSDRFRRTAIADLLGSYRTGADRIHPELAVEELLKRHGAADDVFIAGGQLTAHTPAPQSGRFSPQYTTRSLLEESALRMYQEEARRIFQQELHANPATATRKGAEGAVKFGQKIEEQLGSYARAQTEIQTTNMSFQRAVRRLNEYEKSAFHAFGQYADPDRAIMEVMNSQNPGGVISRMARDMRADGNEAALNGLKQVLIDRMRQEAGGSMVKLRTIFDKARWQQALGGSSRGGEPLFTPREMQRMSRILQLMEGAERGDKGALRRLATSGLMGVAGIAGIHAGGIGAGALAAGAAGYGSLAFPAALKRIFQNNVQGFFTKEAADAMLTRVLLDPRVERSQMRSIPTVWNEAAKYSKMTNRVTNSVLGAIDGYEASRKKRARDMRAERGPPTGIEFDADGRRVPLRAGLGPESYDAAEADIITRDSKNKARVESEYDRAVQERMAGDPGQVEGTRLYNQQLLDGVRGGRRAAPVGDLFQGRESDRVEVRPRQTLGEVQTEQRLGMERAVRIRKLMQRYDVDQETANDILNRTDAIKKGKAK